jgi:hypothetical protein
MDKSCEKMSRVRYSSLFNDWMGRFDMEFLWANVSIKVGVNRCGTVLSPSLVGEGVIIQPFVGQHETKHNQLERCVGFHSVPIKSVESVTKKFKSETVLLRRLRTKGGSIEEHGKPDDVPQTEKNGRWLEQRGQK